ncbi:MAG: hypothetical protein JOZ54_19370 [Acidobacteria bacterium]|nr:hypothetical protein [Acidobacteriota bacterium]
MRYGLAILKTMVFYKLHKKRIWSYKIFRDRAVSRPRAGGPTAGEARPVS